MTIQQCKYVLAVAKKGSFSEAAKQLFVAQSSLSISIKSLEQELSIKIFERSGNGVYLTDEGAEFVKYASQICESDDYIAERYKTKSIKKKLYIATQHYDFIADIFGNFVKDAQIESYRFSIREIETYNVIHDVQTGHSDIGIIAIKDGDSEIMKRYLGKRNLQFTPLLEAKPHIFFRKDHPLAMSKQLSMSDLKAYPYVSYEQGEHNSTYFTEELTDISYIDKHIEISDRATLMNLLLLTDAYTVGTGIMPSALNKGDIISVPFKSNEFYIIGYILNEERKISDITHEFIRLMEKQAVPAPKPHNNI
ncbi:MAG: LysR family transcriptional regulator [Clostridia bacterium]|nr:LysR family transcriptional regulator [Clostridia bacterium]